MAVTLVCSWEKRKNPDPATHDRDRTAAEQRNARRRRINEAGVPCSQDSITRRVQSLQISDTPAAQTALPAPAPPPMPNTRRPPQARPKQQPRAFAVRNVAQILSPSEQSPITASCCTWSRSTGDNGCSQKAMRSSGTSIAQPEKLVTPSGRGDVADAPSAEVILRSETLLAIPLRTVANPGTRMQRLAVQQSPQGSQPVPPGDLLDDRPLPNCPVRDVLLTERDKQLLAELRRASSITLPRCISRYATAWALCRYRCRLVLAEVPKATDRNSELKLRLRICGRRGRSVSSSPRYWDSNTLVRSAVENGRCCRRRMNSAGNEVAP